MDKNINELPEPTPYYHKPQMYFKKYDLFFNRDFTLKNVVPNRHNYYEFLFLIKGDVEYSVAGHTYSLINGDIILICPNQEHHATINASRDRPYERYVLWIDSAYMEELSSSRTNLSAIFQSDYIATSRIRPPKEMGFHIKKLLENIFINLHSTNYGADLLGNAYIIELLVTLVQSKLFYSNVEFEYIAQKSTTNEPVIMQILEYINIHIYEPIRLSDICDTFFISRSALSKLFTKTIGIPIYQYIMKKKLFMAKQDLTGHVPLQVICEKYSFGDYSSFYKAFRSEYGQSPKQYKNSLKVNEKKALT